MLFNSINYLIFFPIVVFIYYLIPKRIKHLWLLCASYFFYMCWNAKYALLMLFSTLVTYGCGYLLDIIKSKSLNEKKELLLKRFTIIVSLLLNLGILFYFKYINFALQTIIKLFQLVNIEISIPSFDIILPVGISFFTFQAIGYTIDVYRGEIKAERNLFRYALFVSFFPQLVAGPIERSKNLLTQLHTAHKFDVSQAESGLLTMVYGLFLKVVIADNISNVIDPVFSSPEQYMGMELLLAVILFAFQIYCDFEGYSKLAIGSARVLGIHLNQNFNSPYLASSVKDFWRRWHISLTSWFRDYLYISLGGNRKGVLRKHFNMMIIFLCSGLWHGAGWKFIVWGGLNGLFCITEDLFKPINEKWFYKLKINKCTFSYKLFQRIAAFLLIDFTWIFFRAETLRSAIYILCKIVEEFKFEWILVAEYLNTFISPQQFIVITLSLLVLFVIDYLRYKKINLQELFFSQQFLFRWIVYFFLFLLIIYWGAYGTDYEQTQFIYFQF
ncbi:MAG: MBOAT family protein [Lachnospiraceae bacterium]|nr:MBOAT family protein [Lachnospiraceae bacterium]